MALQHFIFVTHDAPGSVRLAADFNKHLMRVPLSRFDLAHAGYPLHSCLDGKQAQIERPHARTFMEDADLSLVKQIFDVPHDREGGDDLMRYPEMAASISSHKERLPRLTYLRKLPVSLISP